jgi:hypothetical protein
MYGGRRIFRMSQRADGWGFFHRAGTFGANGGLAVDGGFAMGAGLSVLVGDEPLDEDD